MTDCRTEEGITEGLIDSLIFICRILAKRNLSFNSVKYALADLRCDEDINFIVNGLEEKDDCSLEGTLPNGSK